MKTYKLIKTPVNNHGCMGVRVEIQPTGPRTGIIVDARACSSSWPQGCTGEHGFVVGEHVELPEWFDGNWEEASEIDPETELSLDVSPNLCTVVRPYDLIRLDAADTE